MTDNAKRNTTIAILAYNEAKFIYEAVISAVNQTDNLIIYDNFSTDETESICRKLVYKYPNIKYIRHQQNLGGTKNFEYSLYNCSTKYFMWMDGHDILPENFISTLYKHLSQQPDSVLAYSPIEYIDEDGKTTDYYEYWFNDRLSADDPFTRTNSIVKYLYNCNLVKCLFEANSLKKSWNKDIFYKCINWDHILLCKAASIGRFIYNTSIKYKRRRFQKDEKKHTEPQNNHLLKKAQLDIINNLHTINIFKKFYYYNQAKKTLIQRFGNE